MSEVNIKEEKEDSDDNDDCIPELTKLLEEVQREEESQPDKVNDCPAEITNLLLEFKREDESGPADDGDSDTGLAQLLEDVKRENQSLPVASSNEKQISEKFIENECNTDSIENRASVEDDDIEILQELLRQKQRELEEAESANISSSNTDSRKRKTKTRDGKGKDSKKRKKNENNELRRSRSRSVSETETENPPVVEQTQPSCSSTEIIPDIETDILQLLKAEDDNSDEDAQDAPPLSNVQSNCMLPTGLPADVETFGQNQMVGYQPTFASGAPFFMPNMGMPMMGYGHPQMNIQNDQHEVECLPVINSSGFLGMPTFKRIKLERISEQCNKENDETKDSPEEKRKKVLEACSSLLEQLEFPEPTGKFIYTPTVTKVTSETASNSVLQKIFNLSYEFQSIGPKLNLADWGLREIASCNADVAKKIGLSAEKYFAKIAEKANTTARKLIKVEDAAADENRETDEIEEPTLSTFLKNSMTQTEPLSCRECAVRKRIVGHHIGVQATVGSGSVGSQTVSFYENNDRQSLTAGLNHKQLSALFKFSNLIREPSKNTTVEMCKLRETLLDIYNSSTTPNFEAGQSNRPAMDPLSHSYAHSTHVPIRETRIENGLNDPRLYSHSSMPNIEGVASRNHSLGFDPHMMNQRHMPHRMRTPEYNPTPINYPVHQIQGPYVRPRYVSPRHQPPDMHETRKSYGRGGQMHF